ncbi:MAG: diguanylate cyclase [Caldiserica bacterium]|jgi:diguanylate cyclase (GGDEF)-like protein|nr:diguanylate cyclase [Caldisericota bacterium]MDH7562877.1 diguanylate cyclase [Caldisericota bacterium]
MGSFKSNETFEYLSGIIHSPFKNPESFLENFLSKTLFFSGGTIAVLLLWDPPTLSFQLKVFPREMAFHLPSRIDPADPEVESLTQIKGPVILEKCSLEDLPLGNIFPFFKSSIGSALIAPLSLQGRSFGTVLVISQRENAFNKDQLDWFSIASNIVSLFLENQRQTQENRSRLQQMKTLIDVSRQINSTLYLEEAVRAVTRSAKDLLSLDEVFVFLIEENRFVPFELQESRYSHLSAKLSEVFNAAFPELREQRKPIIFNQFPQDFLSSYSISSTGLLPILYQEKLLGFLVIPLPPKKTLLPEELLVAQSLANQCGVAITNSRLFHETRQKADEFSSLFDIAQALMGSMDMEEIVSKILDSAQRLVEADEGFIFEKVEGSQEMRCIAASGSYQDQIKSMKIRIGEGITGWVAKEGVGVNLAEAELDPRVKQVNGTPVEEESLISLPLKIKDEVIGAMTVYRLGHRPFSDSEFRLITIFSSFAASALYNARLFKSVSEMAITDYLTGLYNYRYFFRRLEEELAFAQRHNQKLTLVYLDLDHFKKFNDIFGHREGDKVLAKFAQVLKENIRVSDVVFRYGGEEFVIILPSTDSPEAEQIIQRLNTKIEEAFPPNLQVPISASIGYSVFPTDATDGETLLRIADSRMYAQKGSKKALSV